MPIQIHTHVLSRSNKRKQEITSIFFLYCSRSSSIEGSPWRGWRFRRDVNASIFCKRTILLNYKHNKVRISFFNAMDMRLSDLGFTENKCVEIFRDCLEEHKQLLWMTKTQCSWFSIFQKLHTVKGRMLFQATKKL